jgi:hypothetical protein
MWTPEVEKTKGSGFETPGTTGTFLFMYHKLRRFKVYTVGDNVLPNVRIVTGHDNNSLLAGDPLTHILLVLSSTKKSTYVSSVVDPDP